MSTFQKAGKYVEKISDSFFFVAGLSIILMVAVTTADVILRYFRIPFRGAYDIVSILSALSISFAVARTTLQKGHIAVNLVTRLLPVKIQKYLAVFTNVLSFVLLFFLGRQLFNYATHMKRTGEVSLTIQIPYSYIMYAISVSLYFVCIIELYDTIKNIREIDDL